MGCYRCGERKAVTDLVERLREMRNEPWSTPVSMFDVRQKLGEAADEIERLRAGLRDGKVVESSE